MTKRKTPEPSNPVIPSLIPCDWQIIYYRHSDTFHRCICGHNVKRLTYIYNKQTCEIMRVGTTCVKKYGITQHMTNSLLFVVLQKYIVDEIDSIHETHEDSYVFTEIESCLRTCIQEKYKEINEKIEKGKTTDETASSSVNYYDVVVPFRRLLTETCDLVMEYKFLSLKELLQEIEDNINLLDNNIKHRMIDEYEISSEASDASDASSTTASTVDTLDTISEIDEDSAETYPEIQAVLEDILQNIVREPIVDTMIVPDEDNITTKPMSENITTIESSSPPFRCCNGSSICYCMVHYRLNNLEYNIQEFKKDVQVYISNIKQTKELYRNMIETYKPLLNSSSTESSSS